jgi:predicted metal-dependent hydrolase
LTKLPRFVRKIARPTADHFEIATDSGLVSVDIRRHPRARNYTLRVAGPAKPPVLTMPQRGSLREARAFLYRHSAWLKRQIDRLPQPAPIADGVTIPIRGTPHIVRHVPERRGTVAVETGEALPTLAVAGEASHLRRRVLDFMKREARRDIETAVLRHAATLGVRPKVIRLRDQTSRWGSCSATGQLSFSWRLIMAPPFVLEYLAAHEVAHLRELNQSRRFWRLVEWLCPETKQARAWLQSRGAALHAIGVEG